MFRFVFAFLGVALLAGCASNPVAYDPAHSEAFNVMSAAVGRQTVERYLPDSGPAKEGGGHTAMAVATGAGEIAASTVPGVSLSPLSIVGSVLLAGSAPDDRKLFVRDGIMTWMPKSFAPNEETAREKFVRENALLLSNILEHEGYSVKNIEYKEGNNGYYYAVINGSGKGCLEKRRLSMLAAIGTKAPKETIFPAWIGNGDAWSFSPMVNSFIGVDNSCMDKSLIVKAFSEKNQDMYIYLTKKESPPVIIHQGKILSFVKPQVTAAK